MNPTPWEDFLIITGLGFIGVLLVLTVHPVVGLVVGAALLVSYDRMVEP